MEPLHAVLTAHQEEVILRWKALVQGTLAPQGMPSIELLDHVPMFLQDVIAALREDARLSPASSLNKSPTAADHGEQRLRLGFSLDSVVREYGSLSNAIVATAKEKGASMSLRELQVIFDAIVVGIAEAVSEYSRQRDAEMQRQHNEHFAFLAHELRNPLSSAAMGFEHLKRKGQIQTDARATASLQRGLHRMQELIDHSLNVARVASGVEVRTERVRLKALLEEAEMFASSESEEKNIELRLRIEQDEDIHLDVRLVRSALHNLVRNAVKYTSPGGVVELRGSVSGGRISIEIEDCCGGLPPGKVEEAFAPFVRMDRRESGFGLGLAIAKQAVDAHGGTMRVQNLPGKGCVFVMGFPIVGPP